MSERRASGEVVPFRVPGAAIRKREVRRPSDATILLFTGVRYERGDDGTPPPPPMTRTLPAGDARLGG